MSFAQSFRYLPLFFALVGPCAAQTHPLPPRSPVQPSAQLAAKSFSAKGLNFEKELTGIYLGDFGNIRLDSNSMEFDVLFGGYLTAFATKCEAYLPPNKVEMMKSECATESRPVNRYGTPVGPPTCVSYREVGRGLYADPELYAAEKQVDAVVGRAVFKDALSNLSAKNPFGAAMHTMDAVTSSGNDMESLLEMNACNSAAIKRLQDNMLAFALGRQPRHLPGGETLASIAPPKSADGRFQDSNYGKLLDDLITEQSKAWMVNRYVAGSASRVVVAARDQGGRPSKLAGDYLFDSFSGRRKGSVTVEFSGGLPECMYFSDFPTTCRSPSRKVINAYESGGYRQ